MQPNKRARIGSTHAIVRACANGNLEVLKALVRNDERGFSVLSECQQAIDQAAGAGHTKVISGCGDFDPVTCFGLYVFNVAQNAHLDGDL